MKLRVSRTVDKDGNPILNSDGTPEINYWFWCPGCDSQHRITNIWEFDGNVESPTFAPSILCHEAPSHPRCHSYLRNGIMEFLSDCTHAMASQNVPLPDLPEWLAR